AEDGIRDFHVTGVQTCALPILARPIIMMAVNIFCIMIALEFNIKPYQHGPRLRIVAQVGAGRPGIDAEAYFRIKPTVMGKRIQRSEARRGGDESRAGWGNGTYL